MKPAKPPAFDDSVLEGGSKKTLKKPLASQTI